MGVPESTFEDSSEVPVVKKRRHAALTDADLDNVAAERLSKNTEHQTRWAVKLFKGKSFFCNVKMRPKLNHSSNYTLFCNYSGFWLLRVPLM